MTKPIKEPPQVVSLRPRRATGNLSGTGFNSLEKLLKSSQKLRLLEETIGRPAIQAFVDLEGEAKALTIIHRFVQYYDDFANRTDFQLYAFACGQYLMKKGEGGKYVESFPVNFHRSENRRERANHLNATRRLARYFSDLNLSPEQARSFITEASPFVFPLFLAKGFNAGIMLKEFFVKDLIGKFGLDKSMQALRAAVQARPDNLEAEVYRRIKEL